ncbi:hypothetical protein [Agromyces subbeticus]|uniref:hypothetical protein n=1 Tax=Agromyces subbeticus TaxID=293890 RepID=UPI0003FA3C10|nr:hypothetical protein [Agromyces subbeticus]
MHTSPRIAFSQFRSGEDPMLLAWARFRSRLAPAPDVASIGDRLGSVAKEPLSIERTIWRLFASNNREVARSARVYGSFLAAREHVLMLQSRVAELDVQFVRGPETGSYGWTVALDDRAAATCARWYPSSACTEAVTSALVLLDHADVAKEWRWASGGGGQRPVAETSTWR